MEHDIRHSRPVDAHKDGGLNWTTVWGVGGVPYSNSDASGATVYVTDAPTPTGRFIVIDDMMISVGSTAMSLTFYEETSGTVIFGPIYMPANSFIQITPRGKGKKTKFADKRVRVQASVAGQVMIDLGYHSETGA